MISADAALLIVDDNDDNRYTLTRRLSREGYKNLSTAANGHEALALLRSRPFDLVLLDVMMPDMNGYEVLEHLNTSPDLRDVPVIMISALDEIESVIRCVELGAEDYLSKPFNPTLLRARIGASLEKKRLRDELRMSLDRLRREMDAARTLQLDMLPRVFPLRSSDQPVEISALMEPAWEVGGDLYDCYYASPSMLCCLVGDVSGKGAQAAMFMARARSLIRMAGQLLQRTESEELSPARIAEVVNAELCQNNDQRMFVTLFLGLLDTETGVLQYLNAGHPAPYILRAAGDIERVGGKPEMPLGVRHNIEYEGNTLTLQQGDAIFIYTDGVIEAMNGNSEFYKPERLEADLRAVCKGAPDEMVRTVKQNVDRFTGAAPKADDITILALRWFPG